MSILVFMDRAANMNDFHYKAENFCMECNVYKRPDMLHCEYCFICVEGYDHHCGVIGMCVGDQNFKYFLQMIAYGALDLFLISKSLFTFTLSIDDDSQVYKP